MLHAKLTNLCGLWLSAFLYIAKLIIVVLITPTNCCVLYQTPIVCVCTSTPLSLEITVLCIGGVSERFSYLCVNTYPGNWMWSCEGKLVKLGIGGRGEACCSLTPRPLSF